MPRLPFVTLLALLGSTSALLAADWKADPPAKASEWKPAGLPVDLGKTLSHVDFADHFGPFALVTEQSAGKERIVFDLTTGREVARVPQKEAAVFGAMPDIPSPDGTFSARTPQPLGKFLEVTTLADGTVRKVELPFHTAQYAWLDSKRLIIVGGFGKTQIAVVDAGAGTVGTPVLLPGVAFTPLMGARNFAASPGGRYAAIPTDKGIVFFDATSSTAELTIALPLIAGKSPTGIPVPPAVAFSADGTKIALLDGAALKVWTPGTATPTSAAVVRGKRVGSSDVRPLQAVRSGGWLIDDENATDAAGRSVRVIPYDGRTVSARLALDADTILTARKAKEGIGHELAVVGESGAKVQPAVAADYAKARKIEPGVEPFLGSFQPAPPAPTPKPFELETKEFRSVVGLHVARTGTWAAIEIDSSPSIDTVQKRAVLVWAEGASTVPAELPPERRVFGELAGDAGFLTIDTKPTGAATLAFHDAAGAMVCRWQPGAETLYAALIDTTRAVTLERSGRLVGWKLPTGEAEWTMDLPGAAMATLSPRGDRIVVATPTGLHIVDTRSGNGLGIIAAKLGSNFFYAGLCVRADGEQILSGQSGLLGRQYRVWSLSGTRAAKEFSGPMAGSATLLHLGGDLVFDGHNVVDVGKESAVWEVNASLSRWAVTQPGDGRIWYIHPKGTSSYFRVLSAVPFPRAGVEGLLKLVDGSTDRVLIPGGSARVELDFPEAPARFRDDALAKATERLRTAKIAVSDDAPVTLHLNARVVPTGETLNLTWRDIKKLGQQETLKPYSVRCTSELRRGAEVIRTGVPVEFRMETGTSRDIIITDDSKTAKEFFERQVWGRVAFWAGSSMAVPGATAKTSDGQPISLPGRSRLDNGTLITDWPKGYSPPPEPSDAPADGMPTADGAPAASKPKWVWIAGGGCGAVALLGLALVGFIVWKSRGKRPTRLPPAKKRRPRDDDEE